MQFLQDADIEWYEDEDGEIVVYDDDGEEDQTESRWIDGTRFYNVSDGWTWVVVGRPGAAAAACAAA